MDDVLIIRCNTQEQATLKIEIKDTTFITI